MDHFKIRLWYEDCTQLCLELSKGLTRRGLFRVRHAKMLLHHEERRPPQTSTVGPWASLTTGHLCNTKFAGVYCLVLPSMLNVIGKPAFMMYSESKCFRFSRFRAHVVRQGRRSPPNAPAVS